MLLYTKRTNHLVTWASLYVKQPQQIRLDYIRMGHAELFVI